MGNQGLQVPLFWFELWWWLTEGDSVVDAPFPMSWVLWSRKVPDRIVTNPHSSVAICDPFCESQSCSWEGGKNEGKEDIKKEKKKVTEE